MKRGGGGGKLKKNSQPLGIQFGLKYGKGMGQGWPPHTPTLDLHG